MVPRGWQDDPPGKPLSSVMTHVQSSGPKWWEERTDFCIPALPPYTLCVLRVVPPQKTQWKTTKYKNHKNQYICSSLFKIKYGSIYLSLVTKHTDNSTPLPHPNPAFLY